jgi:hypothetical protein
VWFAFVAESVGIGIFMRSAISRKNKEKRERIHILLPLSVKQIAIARIFLPILFWMGFIIWFWINISIFRFDSIDITIIWLVFSITGLYLCFNAAVFMSYDLNFYEMQKRNKAILKIISIAWIQILVIILLWFYMGTLDETAPTFITLVLSSLEFLFYSQWGVFGFITLGLISTFLSIVVFKKRKSYME